MKFIKKLRHGLERLELWKDQEENHLQHLYKSLKADAAWNHLKSTRGRHESNIINYTKKELKNSLIKEQGCLCCYCQKRVGNRNIDHDIEHLIPKSIDPKKYTFDYKNLCVSCKTGSQKNRPMSEVTCNEARQAVSLSFLPTDRDIESKYRYTEDGQIIGVSAEVNNEIDILNLNSINLIRNRRMIIEGILFADIYGKSLIDKKDLVRLKHKISTKKNNKFDEFRQVKLFIINEYLKK